MLTPDDPKILDMDPEAEEDGANQDLDSMRKGKCAVIKTSTRQVTLARIATSLGDAVLTVCLDNIPSSNWSRPRRKTQTRRFDWRQQGVLLDSRYLTGRIRLESESDGG